MKEKEKIDEQKILSSAKQIMDDFVRELEQEKDMPQFGDYVKRDANKRLPGKTNETDADFIRRMFDNASKKRDGYIIAERKKGD